jgi:hypothetical protein
MNDEPSVSPEVSRAGALIGQALVYVMLVVIAAPFVIGPLFWFLYTFHIIPSPADAALYRVP